MTIILIYKRKRQTGRVLPTSQREGIRPDFNETSDIGAK